LVARPADAELGGAEGGEDTGGVGVEGVFDHVERPELEGFGH
jgi:hypothetical protein